MAPAKLPPCKICDKKEAGKYRCPVDDIPYCSVVCFKQHKSSTCSSEYKYQPPVLPVIPQPDPKEVDERPTKRLRDLQWPPEPDAALWDDPLKRDDIKPLRGFEYQAITTSLPLRASLASPSLQVTLERLSSLPVQARQAALRVLLGLPPDAAPTVYRPAPSQCFSTGSQTLSAVTSGRGRGGSRGRGRGRGGSHGNAGDAGGDIKLLESTPEERKETSDFVDMVLAVLHDEREKRRG